MLERVRLEVQTWVVAMDREDCISTQQKWPSPNSEKKVLHEQNRAFRRL